MSLAARTRRARAVRLVLEYLDLIAAAAVALVAIVLGFAHVLEGDDLTEVVVLLLAALAVTMIRERFLRDRALQEVTDLSTVAHSGKSWEILNATHTWDIQDDGSADVRSVKELRFLQDEVISVYEFYNPTGSSTDPECTGGAVGGYQKKLKVLHTNFPGPKGRRYRIISLEGMWHRGQRMTFTVARSLSDCFVEEHESVGVEVEIPTDYLTLKVVWPQNRVPHAVQLERADRLTLIKGEDLPVDSGGRRSYEVEVPQPALHEAILIGWDWET